MLDAHRELDARYRALRAARDGPVFFIEHGLDAAARGDLRAQVAAQLEHDGGFARARWRAHPLPLLVVATEVGYTYQGSGTDFWPTLEVALGVRVTLADRQRLRDLFTEAAATYRGARPPETPWARAFHLIAWPITHALVPRELHRPLAQTLARLRVSLSGLSEEALHSAVRLAAAAPPPRFAALLEDRAVVSAVARGLLGVSQASLCAETLRRLAADLELDHVARRGVEVARRRQQGAPRAAPATPSPRPAAGSVALRCRADRAALEVTLPRLPEGDDTTALRRALRRRRYAPSLWGVSAPVPSEQLLSGFPFPVKLTAPPAENAALLPDLDALGLSPALTAPLAALTLDLAPPLVFAVAEDGEPGRRVRGPDVSSGRAYWILSAPGGGPAALPALSPAGPYARHLADPSTDAGRAALEALGFRLRGGLSARLVGPPPLHREAQTPTFAVDDRPLVIARRAPPEGLRVTWGDAQARLSGDDVAVLRVPPGAHEVLISAEGEAQALAFAGAPPPLDAPPAVCWVEHAAGEATIEGLTRGALVFSVESYAPLEGLELTAELDIDGKRFYATAPLGPLPCAVDTAREPFAALLNGSEVHSALTLATSLTLRLRVGHLCTQTLALARRARPCWWQRGDLTLTSEVGELPMGWVSLTDPAAPVTADPTPPLAEARLVAPVAPDAAVHGAAAAFTARCVAPPSGALTPPAIAKPRLLRQRASHPEGLGADALAEAYLRWSLAEPMSALAGLRRRYAANTLEGWLVEVCCGEEWARREAATVHSDRWQALSEVCEARGLGVDPYVDLCPKEAALLKQLRLQALRTQHPDLWFRFSPPRELTEPDYEALDAACADAYARLAEALSARGLRDRAEEVEEADPGAPAAEWEEALAEAEARARSAATLEPLAALLLPSDSARPLMTLNPTALSLDALADELASWAEGAQRAFAGAAPARDLLKTLVAVWVAPEVAVERDWRAALGVALTERAVARAARYLALRSGQRHAGGEV